VPRPDTTRQQDFAGRAKTLLFLLFVFFLFAYLGVRLSPAVQGTDFPDFYTAARMLADGRGHQLYDAEVQRRYQARYAARVGTLYIHPPFEAVLYLGVAWLPLKYAYLLWSLLNLVFLAASCCILARELLQRWDWRIMLAASLAFVPLALCIQQGQDSLLLLLLIVLAFTRLRRGDAFAAGCWLGLGLFKFQLVLPLAVVLLLRRNSSARYALAKGFGLITFVLVGLSPAISGWSVFRAYPAFLSRLGAQKFAGVFPRAMANFRGSIYFFLHSDRSTAAIAAVCIGSMLALLATLFVWNGPRRPATALPAVESRDDFDLAFVNTVLFALLVSYHLNPHDLTLLLLPIAVLLYRAFAPAARTADRITAGLAGILFLPPLHLWALQRNAYALISIPVLLLFVITASIAARSIDVS